MKYRSNYWNTVKLGPNYREILLLESLQENNWLKTEDNFSDLISEWLLVAELASSFNPANDSQELFTAATAPLLLQFIEFILFQIQMYIMTQN